MCHIAQSLVMLAVFVVSVQSQCPFTNLASGIQAEVTGSTKTGTVSVNLEFSDVTSFTADDMDRSSCLPSAHGVDYIWALNFSDTVFVDHILVLSDAADVGSVRSDVIIPCCSDNMTQSECLSGTCDQVELLGQLGAYYVINMTCQQSDVTGTYVRIVAPANKRGTGVTSLCGVKIIGCVMEYAFDRKENLAFEKSTNQSSVWSLNSESYFAVDGKRGTVFGDGNNGSCTKTKRRGFTPHWWFVDLEVVAAVNLITIINRDDDCQCGDLLKDFTVQVGLPGVDNNVTYRDCHFHAGSAGVVTNITCHQPMCGRYIRLIKHKDDVEFLTICEFEVYGYVYSGTEYPVDRKSTTMEATTSRITHLEATPNSAAIGSHTSTNAKSDLSTTTFI